MSNLDIWESMFADEPMVEVPENMKNEVRQLPIKSSDMPVIGFRGFYCTYQKGRFLLYSANYRLGYWEPKGPTWAKCRAGDMGEGLYKAPDHHVPSPDCTCGLYILSNLSEAPTWFGPAGAVLMGGNPNFRQRIPIVDRDNKEHIAGVVIAACRGGGVVVRHGEQGWRSEWAEPVAFLGDDALIGGDVELTDAVAEQYNVPILDRVGLERYVREWGNKA